MKEVLPVHNFIEVNISIVNIFFYQEMGTICDATIVGWQFFPTLLAFMGDYAY